MHRARTAFNYLTPVGQQNFGSWLVRQQKSKVKVNDYFANIRNTFPIHNCQTAKSKDFSRELF